MKLSNTIYPVLTAVITTLIFIFPMEMQAQTTITSNVNADTTWDAAGSPYIVENNISIRAGNTLTIEPSVEVRFEANIGLSIFGHLQADDALFTSNGTDSRGAWRGIRTAIFSPSSDIGSAEILNSTIQFGGDGAVFAEEGTVVLTNTEISNSNEALKIGSGAESVTINGLTATGNGWPIILQSLTALQTSGTQTITGNDRDGARVDVTSASGTDHVLPQLAVPYVFNNTLTVEQNGVLTIQPDNILKFNDNYGLTINGTLLADGSSGTDPIRFTSLKNDNIGGDTNNDGTGSSPASKDWRGISFNSTAQDASIIDNAEISFAGRRAGSNLTTSDRGAVTIRSASPTIQNSTFLNSYAGIVLTGPAAPTIANNEIGTSERFPMTMTFDANPTLTDNVLSLQDNQFDAIGLIGTTISENATLIKRDFTDLPNITYALWRSDLTIDSGTTLDIEEGVIVKVKDARFVVKGTLNVNGTETDNVVFTSIHDDSEGNPNDTDKNGNDRVPEDRDWDGFVFDTGSDASVMNHTTIRFTGDDGRRYDFGGDVGRFSPRSAIIVADASPSITNTDISQTDLGITVIRDGSPTIADNSISNTRRTPVALSFSANPTLNNNEISNAGIRAIGLVSETVRFDGTIKRQSLGGFENITYAMLGSITIASGTTVSIEPGVVIKGDRQQDLFVNGALSAVGDETNGQIIFTSIKDDNIGNPTDTNNDGNGSAPEKGDWGAIVFRSSIDDVNSILDNVEIRFGHHGIAMRSASVPVKNSLITNSRFWGISMDGDSSPDIENVTIESSGIEPVAVSISANPSFTNITFNDNGINGLGLIEGMFQNTRSSELNEFGKYVSGSNTITIDATLSKRNIAGIENIAYTIGTDFSSFSALKIGKNTRLKINPGVVMKF